MSQGDVEKFTKKDIILIILKKNLCADKAPE